MDWMNKDSLYFTFLEVSRLHHYRTHVLLDEIGLYHGQPPMLFILNKEDGQSQTELASKLNLKAPTITVMLRRMEKTGLVVRKQDNQDQRISRVYITDKGRQVCDEAIKVAKKIEQEFFERITEEEKTILRRLLMQMKENLEKAIDAKKI